MLTNCAAFSAVSSYGPRRWQRRHHGDEHGELAVAIGGIALVFVKCPGMPSCSDGISGTSSQVKIASTPGKLLVVHH